MQSDKAEEARERVKRKAVEAYHLLKSPAGQELIKDQRKEFLPEDLRGSSVEDTYFALGQRDVIMYLEKLLRVGEANE